MGSICHLRWKLFFHLNSVKNWMVNVICKSHALPFKSDGCYCPYLFPHIGVYLFPFLVFTNNNPKSRPQSCWKPWPITSITLTHNLYHGGGGSDWCNASKLSGDLWNPSAALRLPLTTLETPRQPLVSLRRPSKPLSDPLSPSSDPLRQPFMCFSKIWFMVLSYPSLWSIR